MTQINMAHLSERSTSGSKINFAVFEAKPTSGNNAALLHQLTQAARASGLRVDQSALAYKLGSRVMFEGDPNLVKYLAKGWYPQWTHSISI
ncbi:hypothetical protein [Shewanella glacialipiscicola]|uniref:Uncharacterized protein n=1 Tax=Shewanella glacialipiscicola TaxID=614069 RepID=A0ABQ6J9G7_9GAMM|nr:hypothetical protein [Shewanella glacialipiscicola]MCL1087166.1 hypothetical protein [Shewanella glacialipiscicola]GIU17742.1 hypothetical protein TUM4636_31640 [Shewanella glacialipiscicola]GMA83470.1 hypothetical protein GCM10025855_30030 [Shewanella glacialipiscicola]